MDVDAYSWSSSQPRSIGWSGAFSDITTLKIFFIQPPLSARQEILQRPDFPRRFFCGGVEDELSSVRMHREILDVLHRESNLLGLASECRHSPEASIATDPQQEALI